MASMWTLIIKNSGVAQLVEDLGITIEATSQITLSDQFDYEELASSDDLRTLVNNSSLTVNDGVSDLNAANGVLFLTLYNAKQTEDKFYPRVDLQTSGSSAVHWDNITDAPAFGASNWMAPVLARVLSISVVPTVPTPTLGDFYIDTGNDHLFKYDGATWNDLGAPSLEDRVVNLDDANQAVYEWDGAAWIPHIDPVDNNAVLVNDDGDGKQAQYVYEFPILGWIKIADIDYGEPNTLNNAYNEGGSGVGRDVVVDNGAVKLDATSNTYAPIELTQQSALPTSGLAAGQMAVKDGILCVYDGSRSKWLSVQRIFLAFGRKGTTSNQYLNFAAGSLASNNSGYRISRNATIISMTAQLDASGTADMRVRSNDNAANIATLPVTAALGAQLNTLNVDIAQGDFLQLYSDNATSIEDPMIIVEIAYRP